MLTLTPTGVSRIVSFHDPSLFELFGLPARLDPSGRSLDGYSPTEHDIGGRHR